MEKDTMAYQLAVLRDTQMVQRRLLEKQFPYIDWARMPFSSYGDFFRLRGILDDCGAVWTNAYGRSNEEAEHARKSLDGTKVLFHDEFISPVMTAADFAKDAQDIPAVYSHDDPTFRAILASSEWSEPETTEVGDAQTGDDSTAEDGAQKEEW